MRKKISGVYKISNITNGKVYIGSSVDIKGRWDKHRHDLGKNKHGNRYLQRAWNKYGEDCFRFEIMEEVSGEGLTAEEFKKLLVEGREQYWMDFCGAYLPESGYNICSRAESVLGTKQSAEARRKNGLAHKGQIPWNKGKSGCFTEEWKRQASELHRGNKYRAKLAEDVVLEIAEKYKKGNTSQQKLADEYGVTRGAIQGIVNGKKWKSLGVEKISRPRTNYLVKLSEDIVLEIAERYGKGDISQYQLATEYGVSRGTIQGIVNGRNWKSSGVEKISRPRTNYLVKLSEDIVLEIAERYGKGDISQQKLAAEYGVGVGCVRNIISGRSWKSLGIEKISRPPCGENNSASVLTDQQVKEIRGRGSVRRYGMIKEMAEEYGVDIRTISDILKNKRRIVKENELPQPI